MNIYTHKDQDVVIWAIHMYSEGDAYHENRINVRYAYLQNNGIIGKLRSKVIFESDYSDQFKLTSRKVTLNWNEE